MRRVACGLLFIFMLSRFEAPIFGQSDEPTAAEIVDAYLEAVGGKAKLRSISSVKIVRQSFGRNKRDDRENVSSHKSKKTLLRSRKRWLKTSTLQSSSTFGFDGETYWMKHNEPVARPLPKSRYPFDPLDPVAYPLHIASFPGKLKYAGKSQVGGNRVYRLSVEPATKKPERALRMTPTEFFLTLRRDCW